MSSNPNDPSVQYNASMNDFTAEEKFLADLPLQVTQPFVTYPEVDNDFEKLRKKPGILFLGFFVLSGMSKSLPIPHNITDTLTPILGRLSPQILVIFMDDVFTFAAGLDAIKKKFNSKEVGFTLHNETIRQAAFDTLSLKEQEELALLIGEMGRQERIKQAQPPASHEKRGTTYSNGLFGPDPIKQENKPVTSKEKRILTLIKKANCMPEPQPSPRPAPSTPSPSGASGSSAMHAAQAVPRQSVTPTHNPQPRNNPIPARAPAPAPMPSSGLEYFKQAEKTTPEKLIGVVKSDAQAQKEKIVEKLKTYSAEIENDIDIFSFFVGVSNKQKQATVGKILTHLNANDSIAGLELDVQDKEALEDDKLKAIAEQIHGYDAAIGKVTAAPSPKGIFNF